MTWGVVGVQLIIKWIQRITKPVQIRAKSAFIQYFETEINVKKPKREWRESKKFWILN